jgi:hypothetical protein
MGEHTGRPVSKMPFVAGRHTGGDVGEGHRQRSVAAQWIGHETDDQQAVQVNRPRFTGLVPGAATGLQRAVKAIGVSVDGNAPTYPECSRSVGVGTGRYRLLKGERESPVEQ